MLEWNVILKLTEIYFAYQVRVFSRLMSFSDDEYYEVIQKNKQVKEAFNSIKEICNQLHEKTDCPEDDIDYFLKFIVGKWKN